MSALQFDYIIVGAGSAGSLLANRLSAKHRVLLIEAGGRDDYHWIHIPVGYLHCIGNPRTDWMYQTEPEAGLQGRRLRYPRGKTLGGSSSINGMIYMRGQSRDYDEWARLTGDAQWRWDAVVPAFIKHEHHWRLDSATAAEPGFAQWHGHERLGSTGEWRVERQRLRWDVLDAFAEACVQAGIPKTEDFNAGNNEGVAYFEVNQKAGLRWNTAKAFLRPTCFGRSNFELWTRAQVSKLLLDTAANGTLQCNGVRVWTGHEMLEARASREVILCAGAVNSPQLLQLSGIGPGDHLQNLGLEVKAHLPGVGENLQDHLQIRSVYRVHGAKTLNTLANSWWGKAKIGLEYAATRSGPMSMAPSQLGAFARSDPSYTWPDLEYHVQPLSLDAFGEPLHREPAITASVCNLNPSSRGCVQIVNADFNTAPRIVPNYLSTERDQAVAVRSLRLTRRIVGMPALARYQPEEIKPGPDHESDDSLLDAARHLGTTIFHPVGTTKMGTDHDPMAVLDARMRVRDGRGGLIGALRVVDAGAMPLITSGNTNSPTIMMAEKAAAWILEDAQK